MHPSTFEYLKSTDAHMHDMSYARSLFKNFVKNLEATLPDGPDKTFIMRELRTLAMWANVTITRLPDGTPRE